MVSMVIASLFVFVLALLLAFVEVEAEGRYGWAEKMPTWYRINGWYAKVYAKIMSGRPLTGYHLFMFFLVPGFFHLQYFTDGGVVWSIEGELKMFGLYLAFCPLWDFLWFVMNPDYGIKKFRKEFVWWHSTVYWIGGRVPLDYVMGWVASFVLVGTACVIEGSADSITRHGLTLGLFLLYTSIAILLAPRYHRWRRSMDKRDDRPKTWIHHPVQGDGLIFVKPKRGQ